MKNLWLLAALLLLTVITSLVLIFRPSQGTQPVSPTSSPSPFPVVVSSPNPSASPSDTVNPDQPVLNNLREGDSITSPLHISGTAPGTWFFEGSFPVVLTDWDGKIIAQTTAQAQSGWMTIERVPFTAVLTFEKPAYGERGTLILRRDNPSGLPENDKAIEVTIRFE